MQTERQQQQTIEAAEQTGMNPAVMAAMASVLLSWYFFFVKGDRLRGVFVGLWPPTLLAFATHFELQRITTRLENFLGKDHLMKRVKRMVQTE